LSVMPLAVFACGNRNHLELHNRSSSQARGYC
jgi:hypothetical protein